MAAHCALSNLHPKKVEKLHQKSKQNFRSDSRQKHVTRCTVHCQAPDGLGIFPRIKAITPAITSDVPIQLSKET